MDHNMAVSFVLSIDNEAENVGHEVADEITKLELAAGFFEGRTDMLPAVKLDQ